MTPKQAYEVVTVFFVNEFEIEAEKIKPDARLFEDLELDSIDALDMVGMLESEYDAEIDEEALKQVRTVEDVVNFIIKVIPQDG
jgi:acyl carrier protein